MLSNQQTALGIDALENGELFKASIVKSYWTKTSKGTPNYHVQLQGTCREGMTVNLFHKLYSSTAARKYAQEWLKPFGVSNIEGLIDGDLVGHEITGRVVYRGLFHLVEVLSIDRRPPIGAPWHDRHGDVTAWHYCIQPPEGVYTVEVDDMMPLHPRDGRVRVGTRYLCHIAEGPLDGNVLALDVYDQEIINGMEYPTDGIRTLQDILRLDIPEQVRQVNLIGRKLVVSIVWLDDNPTTNVSIKQQFIKLLDRESEQPNHAGVKVVSERDGSFGLVTDSSSA